MRASRFIDKFGTGKMREDQGVRNLLGKTTAAGAALDAVEGGDKGVNVFAGVIQGKRGADGGFVPDAANCRGTPRGCPAMRHRRIQGRHEACPYGTLRRAQSATLPSGERYG